MPIIIAKIVLFFVHMYQHKGTFSQKLFAWKIEWEIFHRLFPHLNQEQNFGYPFDDNEEMNRYAETLAVSDLIRRVELQIAKLPEAYGKSFRFIVHRDLNHRLKQYEWLAKLNKQPEHVDPRFVATRAS